MAVLNKDTSTCGQDENTHRGLRRSPRTPSTTSASSPPPSSNHHNSQPKKENTKARSKPSPNVSTLPIKTTLEVAKLDDLLCDLTTWKYGITKVRGARANLNEGLRMSFKEFVGLRSFGKDGFDAIASNNRLEHSLIPQAIFNHVITSWQSLLANPTLAIRVTNQYGHPQLGLNAKTRIPSGTRLTGLGFLVLNLPSICYDLEQAGINPELLFANEIKLKRRWQKVGYAVGTGPGRLINHSCRPNCVWLRTDMKTFEGTWELVVETLKDIQVGKVWKFFMNLITLTRAIGVGGLSKRRRGIR